MPSNLITGDKAIQSALKVPNHEIWAAAAARARGEMAAQPNLRRLSDGDGLYVAAGRTMTTGSGQAMTRGGRLR